MKRLYTSIIAALVLLALSAPVSAASLTETSITDYIGFSVHHLVLVADSGGATAEDTSYEINGVVIAVDTDPGATAPTDNYDMTIKNDLGADIMGGALTNRDTANTERAYPLYSDGSASHVVEAPVNSKLTIGVTAGSNTTKNAIVNVYIYTRDEKKGVLSW